MRSATDVLVIGGGPAGLAAAIAARKKGFSVAVADGAKPAIDKACGEGLLPGTLVALRELGIPIETGDGQIFRRIRLIDGAILAEAELTDGEPSASGEPFCIRKWSSGPKNVALRCCGTPQ